MQYIVAVLVGLGLAELATFISTVYLHRVLSHKSIRLHPVLTMFMRFGTWMLTSISPREWVAVHRKHHNFTDVEGDPHSPNVEGYWKIMLANVYYRREANNDDTLEKYADDLPYDHLDKALLRRGTLGFGLTGLILVLLMGLGPGLVALFTLAVVYLLFSAAINGVGHTFGYKTFENDATNLRLLALVTFGEGSAQQPPRPPGFAKALGVPRRIRPGVALHPALGRPPASGGDRQGRPGLGGSPPPHPYNHREPRWHLRRGLTKEQSP